MALINETRRLADLSPATLERYNLAGPRYTSYPTAPAWGEAVTPEIYAAHLRETAESGVHRPLSLYTHLPFCETHCTFCGCNTIISPKRKAVTEPYMTDLAREIELVAQCIGRDREVAQYHWGGGTPTYMTPGQLTRLHAMHQEHYRFAPDAEKSLEIHVNWTTDEHMHALATMGFNRISMGVQDFNEKTQAEINRFQTVGRTREIIALARKLGFQGVNCDLIYGLPYQTVETFAATVDEILDLRPDRLAVYNFAYLPHMLPHQRTLDSATLPSGEEKFRIFLEAHDRFVAAGYRYIGMDHFALPGDELSQAFDAGTMRRNFMGFTTHAGADMLGMGVSAIGDINGMYAQNTKKLPRYRDALAAGALPVERGLRLTDDDQLRRDVIDGLMCRDRVEKAAVEAAHGVVFDDVFAEELVRLAPMIEDELLRVTDEALELTFLGRLFVRNIAMVFDAYLPAQKADKKPMFSRTL